MKIDRHQSQTLLLALVLALSTSAVACGYPLIEDAEESSFLTSTQDYDVQQGETFTVTIVSFERGAVSSSAPPPGTVITPAPDSGVEIIGGGVLVDGAMLFTMRARKPGRHLVDISAPAGTEFDDGRLTVDVLRTDISVESSLVTETSLGGFLYVPMIPGESTVAGFLLKGADGCPIEGGAGFGETDESGFDAALRYAREFGAIRVAAAGCPEIDAGGVEAEISYTGPETDPSQGTVTYSIQADPIISKSLTILGIPRFDSRMVEVPTAVTGTFTRTDEGSCQPFEPGIFPLDWTVRGLGLSQLEVSTPDGSTYQQTGNDGASYSFRSGATTVADDVQAVESVSIGFRLERGAGGALRFGVSGSSRIDVSRASTGEFICDQTADVEATAPIPLPALEYMLNFG